VTVADPTDALGWWSISGSDLIDMLRRTHAGEDPDLVYAEAYANSDVEQIPPKGGDRG
jgi:hypothetical protein